MATEDLSTPEGWNAFVARHGGVAGQAPDQTSNIDPSTQRRLTPDQMYTKYTLGDGSTIAIADAAGSSGIRNIKSMDEKAASVATGTAAQTATVSAAPIPQKSIDAQGNEVTTYWERDPNNPTGPWIQVPGVPASQGAPASTSSEHPPQTDPSGQVWTWNPQKAGGPGYDPSGVTSGAGVDTVAAARATITKNLADAGYSGAQAAALLATTPANIRKTLSDAGLADAQVTDTLGKLDIARQKAGPEIGQIQGQTNQANATAINQQAQAIAATANIPYDQAYKLAQAGYSNAQTADLLQKMGQPTALAGNVTQQANQYMLPNGQVVTTPNVNYAPTDPGKMVAQLNLQASQMRDQINQQVADGKIPADQAVSQFKDWYQQTIAPQAASVQNAQAAQAQLLQQGQANIANTYATTAQNQVTTADTVGKNAADIALRTMPYQVGPGFDKAFNQLMAGYAGAAKGQAPAPIDWSNALVSHGPSPSDLAAQATQQAMARLAPQAGAQPPMPPGYSPLAVNALNATPYNGPDLDARMAAAGSTQQATPSTARPVAPPMPGVPAPGQPTGPNLTPGQPTLPSSQGLNQVGQQPGTGQPGIWNTGMVFQNGRMVPATNANAQGGPVAQMPNAAGGAVAAPAAAATPAASGKLAWPTGPGAGDIITPFSGPAMVSNPNGQLLPVTAYDQSTRPQQGGGVQTTNLGGGAPANINWGTIGMGLPQQPTSQALPQLPSMPQLPQQQFDPNSFNPKAAGGSVPAPAPLTFNPADIYNNNPYVFGTGGNGLTLQQMGVQPSGNATQAVGSTSAGSGGLNLGVGAGGGTVTPSAMSGAPAATFPGLNQGQVGVPGMTRGSQPPFNPWQGSGMPNYMPQQPATPGAVAYGAAPAPVTPAQNNPYAANPYGQWGPPGSWGPASSWGPAGSWGPASSWQ